MKITPVYPVSRQPDIGLGWTCAYDGWILGSRTLHIKHTTSKRCYNRVLQWQQSSHTVHTIWKGNYVEKKSYNPQMVSASRNRHVCWLAATQSPLPGSWQEYHCSAKNPNYMVRDQDEVVCSCDCLNEMVLSDLCFICHNKRFHIWGQSLPWQRENCTRKSRCTTTNASNNNNCIHNIMV